MFRKLGFVVVFSLCGGCTAMQEVGYIAGWTVVGGVALVVAPPYMAIDAINGPERYLMLYEAYRRDDGAYVLRNDVGWFTDQEEPWPRQSAWIVEPRSAETDKKGRIVLSDTNLDRWYFRDNDPSLSAAIPVDPEESVSEYFVSGPRHNQVTLHLADGNEYVFALSEARTLKHGKELRE